MQEFNCLPQKNKSHINQISCIVIGSGSLAIFSCDELLKNDIRILAGIPFDNKFENYLSNNSIKILSLDSISKIYKKNSVDFIFSIVNPILLNKQILEIAKTAINYHDSLLPKYAGAFATARAIINNEDYHGITWHIMNSKFDAGDIIIQNQISIENDETTASLNLKCYEAAKQTFGKILLCIKSNNLTYNPQVLKQRTSYLFNTPPNNAGFLDWSSSIGKLDRTCRGLNFGFYNNSFGLAKVYANGKIYIIKEWSIEKKEQYFPFGKIIFCNKNQINIAVNGGIFQIRNAIGLDGTNLLGEAIIEKNNLKPSDILPIISENDTITLCTLLKESMKYESLWLKQLSQAKFSIKKHHHISETTLECCTINCGPIDVNYIISCLYLILTQHNCHDDIWLHNNFENSFNPYNYFYHYLPLLLEVETAKQFSDIYMNVKQRLNFIKEHKYLAKDVLIRNCTLAISNSSCPLPFIIVKFSNTHTEHISPIVFEMGCDYIKVSLYKCSDPDLSITANVIYKQICSLSKHKVDFNKNINEINIIPSADRYLIQNTNNTLNPHIEHNNRLENLFINATKANPSKIAIIDGDIKLTYQQVDELSNCCAKQIIKNIGSSSSSRLIGVYFNKSWQQIVTVLSILKAGHYFMPLPKEEPLIRMSQILIQSKIFAIVYDSCDSKMLEIQENIIYLKFDDLLINHATLDLPILSDYTSLAYIIFTSGSTGKPKGVMISHKSAVNTILDINRKFDINSKDKVIALSRLNFDLSIYDIFGTFAASATLIMVNSNELLDVETWYNLIIKHKITVWNSAPALMTLLIDYLEVNKLRIKDALQLILLSGDWIPLNLFHRIKNVIHSEFKFISLGGATEASIWSIYYPVNRINKSWKTIPYGTPLDNQQIYILDKSLRMLPIGAIGEIFIGGVGVAMGYLNDIDLTNKHFIIHHQLGKIYKTGDLGRLNWDGNHEIIGRLDSQLKVNGMRIDITEIEHTVSQHPKIKTSKVTTYEVEDQKKLALFIETQEHLEVQELKDYIAAYLPIYMVPSKIIFINQWPITKNGKIDYKKLLNLMDNNLNNVLVNNIPTITSSSLAYKISQIWKDALNLQDMPKYDDNFFQIGGDSMSSLKIAHKIMQLGYKIQSHMIFKYPTIEKLVEKLERNKIIHDQTLRIPNQKFLLTQAQQGLLNASLMNPKKGIYVQQVTWVYTGSLNIEAYKKSWELLILKFECLRIILISDQEKYFQYLSNSAIGAWFQFHYTYSTDIHQFQNNYKTIFYERQEKFKLLDTNLFTVDVFSLNKHKTKILFTFHHIILDGISLDKILNKLHYYYEKQIYQDKYVINQDKSYSQYLMKLAKQYNKHTKLSFWEEYINNLKEKTYLPFYRKGGIHNIIPIVDKINTKIINLDVTNTAAIKNIARELSVTQASVLQAVWSYIISYYTNETIVVNGLVFSGRNSSLDIIDSAGYFLLTLPVQAKIDSEMVFSKFVFKIHTLINQLDNHCTDNSLYSYTQNSRIENSFDHILVFNKTVNFKFKNLRNLKINNLVFYEKTNYPLTITFYLGNELKIKFAYDPKQIDSNKINLVSQHFFNILYHIDKIKNLSLSEIDFFQAKKQKAYTIPEEKAIKLDTINIFDLIQEKANQHPDQYAIICSNGDKYTYQDVIHAIDTYSSKIITLDGPLLLYLPRIVEYVILILLCLKYKKTYIPLSEDIKLDQLQTFYKEANGKNIITSKSILKEPLCSNVDYTYIEDLANSNNKLDIFHSKNEINETAYIIFTSGTTGKPKGVEISQRSLLNLLLGLSKVVHKSCNYKTIAVTTFTFDIAQVEVLLPLINSGTIILPTSDEIKNPLQLKTVINKFKPSLMQSAPAKWETLIDSGWKGEHIQYYLSGGDVLPLSLAKNILSFKPVQFLNLYGPTETTIWATYKEIKTIKDASTIGQPLENTSYLILNHFKKKLPDSITGELYITGLGVAKGYINHPNHYNFLTLDQYSTLNFYKTGDNAYKLINDLYFVGRSDRQKKIRGIRVELDEIERVIIDQTGHSKIAVLEHEGEIILFSEETSYYSKRSGIDLFYFTCESDDYYDGYQFILNTAKKADELGLNAVWIPERHFDQVGSLFPNPAIIAASIANSTQRINIRAGSLVLPINDTIRVAENWAVVDNLSKGRAGVSLATGWHPRDFILAPQKFESRKNDFKQQISEVKALWQGKELNRIDGLNKSTSIKVFPKPYQPSIPIWISATSNPSTFELAGEIGANILTHLLIQDINDLKNNLDIYKSTLYKFGFDPLQKTVTLMLHTFIDKSHQNAVTIATKPLKNYLKQHFQLSKNSSANEYDKNISNQVEDHIDNSLKIYLEQHSLIGSVEHCLSVCKKLKNIGVNDFACLIDFGIEKNIIAENLSYISILNKNLNLPINTYGVKTPQELSLNHLSKVLPEHMIPSKIVSIDKIPLTKHNKIDYKNLKEYINLKYNSPVQSDSSDLDDKIVNGLTNIWNKILEINSISLDNNFFFIGGNSLKAIRVINAIYKEFEIEITIRDFFKFNTLRTQANLIKSLSNESNSSKTIIPKDTYSCPLSFSQEALFFMHQLEPISPRYNDSFAFYINGKLDIHKLEKALFYLSKTHITLNLIIEIKNHCPIQNISEKALTLKTIKKISPLGEFKNDCDAIIENANEPFDIHKELCRFILFMGEHDSILLISMHHIITDGLSLEILVNDLHSFYEKINLGEKINVKTNKAFLSHAVQEKNIKPYYFQNLYNSWKKGIIIKQPIRYLHNYERPKAQHYSGRTKNLKFDHDLYLNLKKSAMAHNTTIYSLLLTAFTLTLRTISKDEQYVIGIPYANRDNIEVEASIGCFVNMLVAIIKCPDLSTTISNIVKAVKESILHAFSYRKLPFNKLVEFEKIHRSLSYHPLFQIVFGMYDSTNMNRYIDGMDFNLLDIDFGIARYDLEVQVIQHIDTLNVYFRYNIEIFSDHIVNNFIKTYNQILHIISNLNMNSKPISSILDLDTSFATHDLPVIKNILNNAAHIDCQKIYIDDNKNLYIEINLDVLNQNYLINNWKSIYNQLYLSNENKYAGWISSYDKKPYTENVMDEWLDNTLSRINRLRPKRILEIGCGSGLLIDKLIHNCEAYDAIDISQFVVKRLIEQYNTEKFSAYVADAYNLPNQIMQKNYDLVILNSTVQYFPSIFYFLKVIEKLLTIVTNGHIFIGDIINSDVALHKNLDIYITNLNHEKNSDNRLYDFCIERLCMDSELAISQNLVASLKNVYSAIKYVATMPKVGIYSSEMNKFRYDCIIGVNVDIDVDRYNIYESDRISFNDIIEKTTPGSIYKISKIPNQHLIGLEHSLQNLMNRNNGYAKNINISLPQYVFSKETYELTSVLNKYRYYYDFLFNADNPLYFDLIILKSYSNKIYSLQNFNTNKTFHTNLLKYWFERYCKNLLYWYKDLRIDIKIDYQDKIKTHNNAITHSENEKFKITSQLIDIWKNILNLSEIPTDKSFFDLGGDSILSIQMVSRSKLVGLTFTPNDLFETQTINTLVERILTSLPQKNAKWHKKTQDLSPIQQWLITQNLHNIHYYNQYLLFEIFSDEPGEIITQKLEELFSSYGNFKLLFLETDNGTYQQYQTDYHQINVKYFDFSNMSTNQQRIAIKQITDNMQQALNIFKGPLSEIGIFSLGKSIFKLVIVAHNMVIDGISWRIIIDDINYLLEHKKLPAKQENNYLEWIEILKNYINSSRSFDTASYWVSRNFQNLSIPKDDWDISENFYKNQISHLIRINLDLIHDLYSFNSESFSIEAFILSSIVYAFHNTFNLNEIYIDIESHGRTNFESNIDLSRSLGWFTEIYPILIEVKGDNKVNILHNVSYKLKESFPFSKAFMALKNYSNNINLKKQLNSYPTPKILFNYFGDLDKSLSSHKYIKLLNEKYDNLHDPINIRPYVFHFDSVIINHNLEIYLRYSSKITSSDEITKIASKIKTYLFAKNINNNCS